MTQITLTSDLAAQLRGLGRPAELCDPQGKVVGRFVPPLIDLSVWEPVGPEISEEELDRRAASDGPWYDTEEVLARLRKR